LLVAGTYLHPTLADPNNAAVAFTEYVVDRMWVASHLMQLAGFALIVAALLFLAQQLEAKTVTGWSRLAAGGAIVSLAVAAALQAVDGIALKTMVDTWAAAPVARQPVAFQAAFAVRQVEVGLAATLSLLLGLTVMTYGIAMLGESTYPNWVGGLAIAGGVPTTVAGVIMAYTGFSESAMTISMPATCILLVWMLALGVMMWRQGRNVVI